MASRSTIGAPHNITPLQPSVKRQPYRGELVRSLFAEKLLR